MGIDANVEQLCRPFHDERTGRPSLAPGICFRLLLGCLPGIDPERGIALTVSHSLGLRRFLGCEPHHNPPDHPTISAPGGGSASKPEARVRLRPVN